MKEPITTNQDNCEKPPIEFTDGTMRDGERRSCLRHSRPQQTSIVVSFTCHCRPYMSQYTVRAGGDEPTLQHYRVSSIIGRRRWPCMYRTPYTIHAPRAGGTCHLFIIHRGHSTTFVPMRYVVSYYNRGYCIPTWLAAAAIA
eukprot:scaffold38295_cov56-Attheya_sp.AAC.2